MIKLIVFDVDGTLTDGRVYYTQHGEKMKCFNIRDGLGINLWNKILHKQSAIISGRESEIVKRRAQELGIEHIFMGVSQKDEVLSKLLKKLRIKSSEVACIGDDVNDLSMFRLCGRTYMPSNGTKILKKYVNKVLKSKGGSGAVREMIEDVMAHNGEKSIEKYFI